MTRIKVVMVEIHDIKNWKGSKAITLSGVCSFVESDGKRHDLITVKESRVNTYGKLYQLVGYNPFAENEEDQFLPIAEDQWSLCTKFIPRNAINNLQANLAINGLLQNLPWQKATLENGSYSLFKKVEL